MTLKSRIEKDLDRFYSGRIVKPPYLDEVSLCEELSRAIGGRTEVCTPVGRIDLINDDLILEAKHAKFAKHAIGQLMCYSIYFERDNKALGIIGHPPKWLPEVAEKLGLLLIVYSFDEFRWRIL